MTATYTLNAEKNGVEIRFDSKPAAAILETIKAAGYRWSRARRLWWAKQSPKALETAQAVAEGRAEAQAPQSTAPALDLWERTRWTPGPGGDECHAHTVGSNYKAGLSNKEIAAIVKRELSRRFPAIRWSVTTKGYNSITVYLKSGPYENHKELSRWEWKDASPELSAIMDYAEKLLASYNWDDSDPYTDYSSRNFYDFVEVYDYQQTEPTEAQRAEIEQFRARMEEEKRKEEEHREQEWQAEQARRAIEAQQAAKLDEERHAVIAELTAAATVRALEPSEQYITSPGGRATDLDRSWLHCVMGVSPPRGSLPAALLACGWDWAEVSLSLAESLRNSPPQAVLWTDESAWHLIWPSLMQGLSAQVVLAHPPASLAPVKGPRQEGIQMIGYLIFKEHERKPPHSITR